ncbi:hypothetical protein RB195_007358 [Necator americanus]
MGYDVKNEKATPFVYMLPYAEFKKTDNETEERYVLQAFQDFDNEDTLTQKRTNIEFTLKDKTVLLLTSSPYCHAYIQCSHAASPGGTRVKFEPNVDLSKFLQTKTKKQKSQYILTGTMNGGALKSEVQKSQLFREIKNLKVSEDTCCPTMFEFTGFMERDTWFEHSVKPIANTYILAKTKRYEKKCVRNRAKETSPAQSFRIEIGGYCAWMRICFDRGNQFCEDESNALSLIFAHNVFIPTDSEQAVMFSLQNEHLLELRINFLIDEPAIQLEYAFSIPTTPGISHTMHLKSYADVGLDPTKLQIHVIKEKWCLARLVNDLGDIHFGFDEEPPIQCINIKSCTCYNYSD